jgi:hypothetical protein
MSNSTKQHPIKAITNFRATTADAVVTMSVNLQGTVYNNPKFAGASPQPVDQPKLKAATDSLMAANAAAVDGGKKTVQQQKHAEKACERHERRDVPPPDQREVRDAALDVRAERMTPRQKIRRNGRAHRQHRHAHAQNDPAQPALHVHASRGHQQRLYKRRRKPRREHCTVQ